MNVIYSDNVKRASEAYPLLQELSNRFVESAERTGHGVTAEWDRKPCPNGRVVYPLRLSNAEDSVSQDFTIEDLRSIIVMSRLLRLLGLLLEKKTDRILQRMAENRN